ncbi:hypothetical protein [Pedobacter westerhofensis]|uniref:hypothetical protein n=1 Tax=Pedobacter westerhofensis TaxID=425512 RepID=UPI0039EF576B
MAGFLLRNSFAHHYICFALIGITVYNHFFLSLTCILAVFGALAIALSLLTYRSVTFGFSKLQCRLKYLLR